MTQICSRAFIHAMAKKGAVSDEWENASLNTTAILLDVENSRIDAPPDATQEQVRALLLKTEDIVELAKKIASFGGLLRGERIIAVKENGRYVVLEGNRRVLACQLLINPDLAPASYGRRLPAIHSDLKKKLSRLPAEIAPSRSAAEVTINYRHTMPGIKPWNAMANGRRFTRLLSDGRTIAELSEEFLMPQTRIVRFLQGYYLILHLRELTCWSPAERSYLEDPALETNPYTRFFELGGAKVPVRLRFDEQGKPVSSLDGALFDKAMEMLARKLLIPHPGTDDPYFDTRATPTEVYQEAFAGHPDLQVLLSAEAPAPEPKPGRKPKSGTNVEGPSNGTSGKVPAGGASPGSEPPAGVTPKSGKGSGGGEKPQPPAKVHDFFKKMGCGLEDQLINQLVTEITAIDYRKYSMAATFLLRALVERVLDYCIVKQNLLPTLMREYHDGGHRGKPEPGLDGVLTFCLNHHNEIFAGNVRAVLQYWQSHKKYSDLVIHAKWMAPDETTLQEAASQTRPFIERVFNGSALKS